MLLGGEAGLRCGEMMALEWRDVDLAKRQLCVQRSDWKGQVTTTKGGRLRYVPMTERLAAALHGAPSSAWRAGAVSERGRAAHAEDRAGPRAAGGARGEGVERGVHILRHTFCSHLAMQGAPARAIQELAGHKDLATTQRYMHLSPAAIEGAIRLLDSAAEPAGRLETCWKRGLPRSLSPLGRTS